MKPYVKFGLVIGVVIATLAWLAVGGINETKTYFKTVAEVQQMGDKAMGKHLRVGGDVVKGSIQRNGREVSFLLKHMEAPEYGKTIAAKVADSNIPEGQLLRVTYTGDEPLPDTFRDGAQALADGRMNADGSFTASRIQAKCASKYEGKPGALKPGTEPTYSRPEPKRTSSL